MLLKITELQNNVSLFFGGGDSNFISKGVPITPDPGINLSFIPSVAKLSVEMREAKRVAHCNLKSKDRCCEI